ncbi:hypothetical protein [Calidithermus chliarophilus]|uniref:hypothetical protein n=1 Tax=Calidithermus chliarophilus TaxID=52023 RepID=UPI00146F9FBA|nr:hypothetical protein [Calidithermus chliarophilus]
MIMQMPETLLLIARQRQQEILQQSSRESLVRRSLAGGGRIGWLEQTKQLVRTLAGRLERPSQEPVGKEVNRGHTPRRHGADGTSAQD